MLNSNLGNWLLTAGTVLCAIAAANSHKSGKLVDLSDTQALAGEYLLHPVAEPTPSTLAEKGASLTQDLVAQLKELGIESVDVQDGESVELSASESLVGKQLSKSILDPTPLVAAGSELTPEVVDKLAAIGLDAVQIRVPRFPVEVVSELETMTGRVLKDDQVLSTEVRELAVGHELSAGDLRELREGGIKLLKLEGEEQPVKIGKSGTFKLTGAKLAEAISFELPEKLRGGSFLTEKHAQELLDAGIAEVPVKVPKIFSFGDWSMRLMFLAGVVCMIGGIALKRTGGGAGADGADAAGEMATIDGVRRKMEEVVRATTALAERVDSLDAAAIHAEVDPILLEGCLPIVDGRTAIIGALGMGGFADVMSSFSSGERRLNRAWSAAVDDYVDEARASVHAAVPHLEKAMSALET